MIIIIRGTDRIELTNKSEIDELIHYFRLIKSKLEKAKFKEERCAGICSFMYNNTKAKKFLKMVLPHLRYMKYEDRENELWWHNNKKLFTEAPENWYKPRIKHVKTCIKYLEKLKEKHNELLNTAKAKTPYPEELDYVYDIKKYWYDIW